VDEAEDVAVMGLTMGLGSRTILSLATKLMVTHPRLCTILASHKYNKLDHKLSHRWGTLSKVSALQLEPFFATIVERLGIYPSIARIKWPRRQPPGHPQSNFFFISKCWSFINK